MTNDASFIPNNQDPNGIMFVSKYGKDKEPHFDIYSGRQKLPCLPDEINLYCSVVFFLEHVKNKMGGCFHSDNKGEFKKLIQTVFPERN